MFSLKSVSKLNKKNTLAKEGLKKTFVQEELLS